MSIQLFKAIWWWHFIHSVQLFRMPSYSGYRFLYSLFSHSPTIFSFLYTYPFGVNDRDIQFGGYEWPGRKAGKKNQRSGHTSSSMPNRLRKMLHMLVIWFGMDMPMSKNISRNRTHSKYWTHVVFFSLSLSSAFHRSSPTIACNVNLYRQVESIIILHFDTNIFVILIIIVQQKGWKSNIWNLSELRKSLPRIKYQMSNSDCVYVHRIQTIYHRINLNRYVQEKAAASEAKDRKRKQKWPLRATTK